MNSQESFAIYASFAAAMVAAVASIYNTVKTNSNNRSIEEFKAKNTSDLASINVRFQDFLQTKNRLETYRIEVQLDLASDLLLSIMEFQDSIWAYWGPFSLGERQEKFGGKTLLERAEIVYKAAQILRIKYYKCHLKFDEERFYNVEKLVNLISDAKLNFDFPDKVALVEFWIEKQFLKSYAPINNAIESLSKLRVATIGA